MEKHSSSERFLSLSDDQFICFAPNNCQIKASWWQIDSFSFHSSEHSCSPRSSLNQQLMYWPLGWSKKTKQTKNGTDISSSFICWLFKHLTNKSNISNHLEYCVSPEEVKRGFSKHFERISARVRLLWSIPTGNIRLLEAAKFSAVFTSHLQTLPACCVVLRLYWMEEFLELFQWQQLLVVAANGTQDQSFRK